MSSHTLIGCKCECGTRLAVHPELERPPKGLSKSPKANVVQVAESVRVRARTFAEGQWRASSRGAA